MEDSHTHILSLPGDNDACFFAVFDGYGGEIFCSDDKTSVTRGSYDNNYKSFFHDELLLKRLKGTAVHSFIYSFIHSFILETYIAPLQETTTQRHSQPSHRQRRRT